MTYSSGRLTFVAGFAVLVVLGVVIDLIRRRKLHERYALLWIVTGLVMLVLAVWRGALYGLADAAGVAYPPSALYMVAGLFVLIVLLHYSTVLSRLSEQNKTLAQRLALLESERENARLARSPRRLSAERAPDITEGVSAPEELELSVVLVNHNGADCLPARARARSPANTATESVEGIVVDSGSTDGSWEDVPELWDRARAIRFDENIGFCAGCNRGRRGRARGGCSPSSTSTASSRRTGIARCGSSSRTSPSRSRPGSC